MIFSRQNDELIASDFWLRNSGLLGALSNNNSLEFRLRWSPGWEPGWILDITQDHSSIKLFFEDEDVVAFIKEDEHLRELASQKHEAEQFWSSIEWKSLEL